jgi:hypothetical protein
MFNEKAFPAQLLPGSDIPAIAGGGSRETLDALKKSGTTEPLTVPVEPLFPLPPKKEGIIRKNAEHSLEN